MYSEKTSNISKGLEVLRAARYTELETLSRTRLLAAETLSRFPDGIPLQILVEEIVASGGSQRFASYVVWDMYETDGGKGTAQLDVKTGVVTPRSQAT